VIIVNWNTKALLQKCLTALFRYEPQTAAYEVVVVDNASTDGSAEMVAEQFPAVRLLRNTANVGFARANNQAIPLTTGRYVFLLNSDTEFCGPTLTPLRAFLDAHPTVGIAGTRLLNPDGSWQPSGDTFPRTPGQMLRDKLRELRFPHDRALWRNRMRAWDVATNFPLDYVIGAAFVIRRATIAEIGLLDEQFFMYAEDIDWCYRAAQAGWQTYYLGALAISHHNRGSSTPTPALARRLQTLRTASLRRFYRKHYGLWTASVCAVIFLLKQWQQGR